MGHRLLGEEEKSSLDAYQLFYTFQITSLHTLNAYSRSYLGVRAKFSVFDFCVGTLYIAVVVNAQATI